MRHLVLTACLLAGAGWAADMSPPPEIKPAAADTLAALRAQPQPGSADWHNLMGYTLRKQARAQLAEAESQYLEALRIAPGHLGANEYLGELYVMKGELAKARERLAELEKLCPAGCAQREDLQRAIAAAM